MTANLCDWKRISRLGIAAILILSPGAQGSDDDTPSAGTGEGEGESLFEERCAVCHDSSIPGIPAREKLASLSPDYIINALSDGLMFEQAYGLSDEQIREIAEYVSRPSD